MERQPSNVTPLRPGESLPPRIPPHNYEAEQALLGAVLANNLVFDKVNEFLRAEHFADAVHGRIYEAIGKLIQRGQIANVLTLKNVFDQDEALAEIGGAQYLARLANAVVTIINAEDVVNQDFIHDLEVSATDQIEVAEQQLYALAETGLTDKGLQPLNVAMTAAIAIAEAAYKRDSHITGVTTGLDDLDKKLGGLHPSDLVILAGRPSMGKTALATNIAFNAALRLRREPDEAGGAARTVDGAIVGFFSLEMSREQIATRILA